MISVTLTTDLTIAFDTVDSPILIKKLEIHGIRGNELRLFTSYLTDRYQYTQIDTMNSKIRQTTDRSTIQGGKISSILYSIYTSEIPQLYRLLDTPLYTEITGNVPLRPDKDTIHETFNFVDD